MTRAWAKAPARHARPRTAAVREARRDSLVRRAVSGDRPYVVAFFVLLAVLTMMVIGPLQSYTAAAERVHDLEVAKIELSQAVADLQEREARLRSPEEVELLARERLGLVKPGEVPYVVTDGKPESDRVRPDGRPLTPPEDPSIWQRISRSFASLFRR